VDIHLNSLPHAGHDPLAYSIDGVRVSSDDVAGIDAVLKHLGEPPLVELPVSHQKRPDGDHEWMHSFYTDGRPKARELLEQMMAPRLARREAGRVAKRQQFIAMIQEQIKQLTIFLEDVQADRDSTGACIFLKELAARWNERGWRTPDIEPGKQWEWKPKFGF
jgi:hypothetical protein